MCPAIASSLADCFTNVNAWCAAKCLQFNAGKTEVMCYGKAADLRKRPAGSGSICAGTEVVEPVSVVCDLGVWIDAELLLRNHISRTTRACYSHLRHLRSIRMLLGRDVTVQLVCTLVLSRLDYCNAVYTGLPASSPFSGPSRIRAEAIWSRDYSPERSALAPNKATRQLQTVHPHSHVSTGRAPLYMSDMLTDCASVPSHARQ